MAATGYVKVWRKMLDSEVMQDDWLCRLWMWCLLKASFQDGRLPRGQFETRKRLAAELLNVSPSKLWRGLVRLQELGCISLKSDHQKTLVTVCKFKSYQDCRSENGPPADHQRTTSGPPADHDPLATLSIKEGKNGRSAASPEAGSQPPVSPVLEFPCVGPEADRHGNLWPLMPAKLAEYRQAFPGVDALSECRKALQWLKDNPTRRKTFGGMPKFLGSWLGRAQDRAGMRGGVPAATPVVEDRLLKTREEMRRRREEEARQRAEAVTKIPPILPRTEPASGDVLRFPRQEAKA